MFLGNRLGIGRARNLSYNPDSIAGLVAHFEADNGVNAKTAADFVSANSEYLSTASADFNPSGSFSMGAWVKFDSIPVSGNHRIIDKDEAGQRAYLLYLDSVSDNLTFGIFQSDTTFKSATDSVARSTSVWYFVGAVYDRTSNLIKISINGGAFITTATDGTLGTSTKDLSFGSGWDYSSAFSMDGQMDIPFFADEVVSLATFQAIYNSGDGLSAEDTYALLTSPVDVWDFNELSGNRSGLNGHTLTDNNTVGAALGKVVEDVTDGDSIFQVLDQKGSNHLEQSTFSNQPLYDSDTPDFNFNGSSHTLVADTLQASLASDTQGTIMFWVRPVDATPAANDFLISFGDTDANTFIGINIQTDGKCRFIAYNTTLRISLVSDSVQFSDNTWTHVAITQDGASGVPKMYIDGSVVSATDTGVGTGNEWLNDYSGLDNGRIATLNQNSSGDANHSNVDMTNILFYNTALTAAQIASLKNYNSPV